MHWDITLGGQENETEKSLEEKKGLVWMVVRESMFFHTRPNKKHPAKGKKPHFDQFSHKNRETFYIK